MGQSKTDSEVTADKVRKEQVDRANLKMAKEIERKQASLANIPLNDEERAFIARIALGMKKTRAIEQPSPAEITRYSQLIKRKDVKI